jgi:hypothetical protein
VRALRVVHVRPNRAAELLRSGSVPGSHTLAFAKLNGTELTREQIDNENLTQLWADTGIDIPLLVHPDEKLRTDPTFFS